MTYAVGDSRVRPAQVMDNYRRVYQKVHRREPRVVHLFDDWYQVNGETVHRLTLFREITRLSDLAQRQRVNMADKSIVQRLINRLRTL